MSAMEKSKKEQELVLALKVGVINWFQYFEAVRALPEVTKE